MRIGHAVALVAERFRLFLELARASMSITRPRWPAGFSLRSSQMYVKMPVL
jgi:hypothetical protein